MKRLLVAGACALALTAGAAQAKDITLTLNDDQQRALVELLNTAVKAGGLGVAQNAVFFYNSMLAAANPPVATPAPTSTEAAPPPVGGAPAATTK